MWFVCILRWFCGTIGFTVEGDFPERFLNLAARNGVQLWNMQGDEGKLSAATKAANEKLIYMLAAKSGASVTKVSEHGFPVITRKYRSRLGLLAGLIIGSLFCVYLSQYIWTIEIKAPDGVNESEIRQELRELGFYEGVKYNSEGVDIIKRQLMLSDERLSWVTINYFGTNMTVEMSMKSEKDKREKSDKNAVSNMLAAKDGIITRINVRKGDARVSRGVGVRSGQLLISGIYETADGKNQLTDCEGEIFAKTMKKVSFSIPKKEEKILMSKSAINKKELCILGISIPLTLTTKPDGESFCCTKRQIATVNGHRLPVILCNEEWTGYERKSISTTRKKAEEKLNVRKKIFELFLENQTDTTILSSSKKTYEKKDCFIMTVEYETEENIAKKSYIEVKTDS